MQRLVIELGETDHSRLKVYAASHRTSMRHLVETMTRALAGDAGAQNEMAYRMAAADKRIPVTSRVQAELRADAFTDYPGRGE